MTQKTLSHTAIADPESTLVNDFRPMMIKCLLTAQIVSSPVWSRQKSPGPAAQSSGVWCLLVVHPPECDVTLCGNRDGGIATLLGQFLLISIGKVHEGPHLPYKPLQWHHNIIIHRCRTRLISNTSQFPIAHLFSEIDIRQYNRIRSPQHEHQGLPAKIQIHSNRSYEPQQFLSNRNFRPRYRSIVRNSRSIKGHVTRRRQAFNAF
jgi:hypothetical protein